MNTPDSKSIHIKIDRRRTRDVLVVFSENGNTVNQLSFNREYLSKMTNFLWMLFAMEIFGNTRNIKYLNEGIQKRLSFPKKWCHND